MKKFIIALAIVLAAELVIPFGIKASNTYLLEKEGCRYVGDGMTVLGRVASLTPYEGIQTGVLALHRDGRVTLSYRGHHRTHHSVNQWLQLIDVQAERNWAVREVGAINTECLSIAS